MGILKKKSKRINENTEIDYRKNKIKYVRMLSCWVEEILQAKGDDRFKHSFISDLDENLTSDQWIEASIFLYDCLLFLVEDTGFGCLLNIPLSHSNNPTNVDEINYSYLKKEIFTEYSPILYLYPLKNVPVEYGKGVFIENLSNELKKLVYFAEVPNEDVGYVRFLFVHGLSSIGEAVAVP